MEQGGARATEATAYPERVVVNQRATHNQWSETSLSVPTDL